LICLGFLLVLPTVAVATPIILSEMSNNEGEIDGVDNEDLDAILTFVVGNFDGDADDELQLTVNNTSTFDIREILFNTSVNVTGVSLLSFPNDDGGWNDTGNGIVGGLGSFDVHIRGNNSVNDGLGQLGTNEDIVNNGDTAIFLFDFTCLIVACSGDDFLVDGNLGKAAAAKFINGFDTLGGLSAFGASSTAAIPEPHTAVLVGLGLVGLAARRR
jgi:hypothetical protein